MKKKKRKKKTHMPLLISLVISFPPSIPTAASKLKMHKGYKKRTSFGVRGIFHVDALQKIEHSSCCDYAFFEWQRVVVG
jgi:hypothetical protein